MRSYRYNALGMLHAKEATGSNTRTTLEELIAGKESADDPDGDAEPRTTTYVYDLTQPYYEVLTESTDGKVTSYTYGLERLAAYTESTKTAYLYDGRGSVIQTNGESKFYSSFGELLTEKVSGYGFNGEYFDAATGMLNLRARQYEPGQGRFSQKDSEKGNVANARSLNAYLYCYNDGVNYFDASGAKPDLVRNVVMADGGGSSTTVKLANKTQIRVGVGQYANRVTNRERILLDNLEQAAQLSYSKKQYTLLKVGRTAVLKGYVCTALNDISIETSDLSHGGHTGSLKAANGKEYNIFDDWYYRIERDHTDPYSEKKHIHVTNKKTKVDYSQDEDGKPHHKNKTPKGPLPNKVQEKLKEKSGWDYEEKRKNFFKMVDENMVRYESTIAYAFTYPDGKTVYRKNKPFFNGENAMERIYYEGSNVDIGDSIIVTPDQIPFIFMPNIYGPMPSFNFGFGSDFVLNPAF